MIDSCQGKSVARGMFKLEPKEFANVGVAAIAELISSIKGQKNGLSIAHPGEQGRCGGDSVAGGDMVVEALQVAMFETYR